MELFLIVALLSGIQSKDIWGPGHVKGIERQSLTVLCEYDEDYTHSVKYWCRGERFSSCSPLVTSINLSNGKISLRDDKRKRTICITMTDLTVQDSGTYWCGISKIWSDEHVLVKVIVDKVRTVLKTKPRTEMPTNKAATTIKMKPSVEPTVSSAHSVETPSHNSLPPPNKETGSTWSEWSDTMTVLGISTGLLLLILCLAIVITVAWRRVGCKQGMLAERNKLQAFEEPTEINYAEITGWRRSQPLCDFNLYANLSATTIQDLSPGGSVEYAAIKH